MSAAIGGVVVLVMLLWVGSMVIEQIHNWRGHRFNESNRARKKESLDAYRSARVVPRERGEHVGAGYEAMEAVE